MLRFTKSNWLTSLLMMVMFAVCGSVYADKVVSFDFNNGDQFGVAKDGVTFTGDDWMQYDGIGYYVNSSTTLTITAERAIKSIVLSHSSGSYIGDFRQDNWVVSGGTTMSSEDKKSLTITPAAGSTTVELSITTEAININTAEVTLEETPTPPAEPEADYVFDCKAGKSQFTYPLTIESTYSSYNADNGFYFGAGKGFTLTSSAGKITKIMFKAVGTDGVELTSFESGAYNGVTLPTMGTLDLATMTWTGSEETVTINAGGYPYCYLTKVYVWIEGGYVDQPVWYGADYAFDLTDTDETLKGTKMTREQYPITVNYTMSNDVTQGAFFFRFGQNLTVKSTDGNLKKICLTPHVFNPDNDLADIITALTATEGTLDITDPNNVIWEGDAEEVTFSCTNQLVVNAVYAWIDGGFKKGPIVSDYHFDLTQLAGEDGNQPIVDNPVTVTGVGAASAEYGAYGWYGNMFTVSTTETPITKITIENILSAQGENIAATSYKNISAINGSGAKIGTIDVTDPERLVWTPNEGETITSVTFKNTSRLGFYIKDAYVDIEGGKPAPEPEGYTYKFALGTDDAEQAGQAISMTEGNVTATGKYIAATEKGAYIAAGRFASGTSKLTLHSDKGNIVKVVYAGLRGLKDEDSEFGGPDWAISNILSYASVTDATGAEIGTFDKDTYTWEGSSSDVVLATSNMTFGFYVEKVYVWYEEGEQEPEGYDYKFVLANPDAKKGSPATFGGENDITVDCYYGGKPEVGAFVNGYNSGNFRIIVHGVEGKNIVKVQLAGVSQNNPKNELTTVLADLSSTPEGLDSLTWTGNAPEVTIWLNSMLGLNVEKIYIWCGAPALDLGADYVFDLDLADATDMTQDGITVTAAKSGNYNLTPNAGPTVSADRNIRKIYLEGTEDIASDVVSAVKSMMYWKAVPTWYPEDNMWKGNTNKVGFHTNTKSGLVTRVHVWADPKDEAQIDDQTVYLASLTEDLEPYRVEVPTATETAYSLVEDQSDMGCPKRLNQGAYTVTLRKADAEGNYRIVYCGYQLDAEANFVAEGALFTVDGKLVRDAEGNAQYYIFTKDDEEYDIANGNSVYSFEDIRETYDNLDREAVAEADAELLQQIDEAIASIADFRVFKDDYLEFSKPISALLDKAKVLKAGTTLWDGVLPFHGYIVSAQQDRTWYMWSKDGVLEFDNKYAETEEADRAKYVIDIYEVDGKVVMQASDGMYVEQVYDQTFIDDDAELGPNEPVHMTDDVTKAADFSVVRATDVSESWDPLRYIIRNMSAIANADGKAPAVLYLEAFWDYNISAMNISGKVYGSTEDTKDAFYFYQLPAPAVKPEFVSSDAPAEPVKSLSTITVTYTEEVQIANAAGVGLYKDGVDEALLNNITMTVNPDDAHQVIITIDDAESLVSMDGAVAYTLEIADGAIANATDADVTADGVAIHFTIYDETVGINGLGFDGKNGNLFNTAGQRVRKNTKGVLIREGVKVIRK